MALMGTPDVGTAKPVAKAETKAAKIEAAKRHAEKVRANRKAAYESALKLKDELTKAGAFDKLTQPVRDFILNLCRDPAERAIVGGSGTSTFVKLFGENPKVGDKLTLDQCYAKTYMGKSTLEMHIKKWAKEKDIVVDITPVQKGQKIGDTLYTLKSMPAK